jgi:ferredoxin
VAYRIRLEARGLEFSCEEKQSLLQAAIEANILMPHSCRAGQCGRCMSRLISGEYFYPNEPYDALSTVEQEQGLLLCCQARPLSDMVINSGL